MRRMPVRRSRRSSLLLVAPGLGDHRRKLRWGEILQHGLKIRKLFDDTGPSGIALSEGRQEREAGRETSGEEWATRDRKIETGTTLVRLEEGKKRVREAGRGSLWYARERETFVMCGVCKRVGGAAERAARIKG